MQVTFESVGGDDSGGGRVRGEVKGVEETEGKRREEGRDGDVSPS